MVQHAGRVLIILGSNPGSLSSWADDCGQTKERSSLNVLICKSDNTHGTAGRHR